MALLCRRVEAVLALALGLALAVAACGDGPHEPPSDVIEVFTFDDGLEGWLAKGTGLMVGGEEIEWSIDATDEHAGTRGGSVRMHLVNDSDEGKIWIEREFTLDPATLHDVTLSFDFGTHDWGDVNLFTIIAGAFPDSPQTGEDLLPAFRGLTGHGTNEPAGLVWLPKRYRFPVTSGPGGEVHVVVGIWGAYEAMRTYFVDEVRVEFTAR